MTFCDGDGATLSLELTSNFFFRFKIYITRISDDGDGDDTLHLLAQPANLPFPDFFNLIIRVSL